jgi:hypothetical protein|tara:strand:- start:567 stop:1001 length:435 start_codon:yes stop_codon:yes gene_type:complete
MATTASLTLSSSDIAGDPVSVSKLFTLTKAGTSNDLDQSSGVQRVHLRSTTQKTLLAANAEGNDLAAKVYIINKSTDTSLYLTVSINAQSTGKLYGGDFMFIPWSQTDTSASIKIAATNWTSSTGDIPVEYALFHEDTDFLTNA